MNDAPLSVTPDISIPRAELEFSAVRASGSGGQHVNKTSTAVELRFDVTKSVALTEAHREKILATADRRINGDGVIVIKAQGSRSQRQNREAAESRLALLLRNALTEQRQRVPTTTPRAERERRRREKARRSAVKATRKPPSSET